MAIINLKSNNFENFIKSNNICVIDFYADWCGPCKMLSPIMESLSKQLTNISFAKINVDQEGMLAQQFNISSIPTVLIFKNAKLVNRFSGFRSEQEIKSLINI
jgi:thioredoxin 1